jgi:hypothetical protein
MHASDFFGRHCYLRRNRLSAGSNEDVRRLRRVISELSQSEVPESGIFPEGPADERFVERCFDIRNQIGRVIQTN